MCGTVFGECRHNWRVIIIREGRSGEGLESTYLGCEDGVLQETREARLNDLKSMNVG
jgi:hypothetical protein